MVARFGLHDGYQLPRFPDGLIVERNLRLSVWELLEEGMLVEGTVTLVAFQDHGGGARPAREVEIRREAPNVLIDGARVLVTWHSPNPHVAHPFFECPLCKRRTRWVFLRDTIACRRCHRLDWAVRHIGRQSPGVARVARLRRRLGGDVRPFAPLPPRRRGAKRAYYQQFVARIHGEEADLLAHLQTVTHDLERRIEVRKRRRQW